MDDALRICICATFAALCVSLTILVFRRLLGRSWFRAMRLPILLAAANYAGWSLLGSLLISIGPTIGFNICRVGVMAWAGFAVTRRRASGLLGAAFAAVAIMFVDHVLLKGGSFLLQHALGHSTEAHPFGMAFGGVIVSFVMFSPVVALLGVCGGLLGRRFNIPAATPDGAASTDLEKERQANGRTN